MREFNYEQSDSMGSGHNPMLPGWKFDLGTDQNGKKWMCKVTPTDTLKHLMWNVDFDTTDEWIAPNVYEVDPGMDMLSTPFLRIEVIYADNYHKATRVYYHRQIVEYKDIYKTACEFMDTHGTK